MRSARGARPGDRRRGLSGTTDSSGGERAPAHPALAATVARLRCPHCGAPLTLVGRVLSCVRGHSYDVARQGPVSLTQRPAVAHGDPAALVAARDAFLGAGHYAPIARAIEVAAAQVAEPAGGAPACAADLGAGTGYYLAALLDQRPGWWGLALDASRPALRRAVRANPRIAGIACDVWQPLPLQDEAADLILDVFAPRNGREMARVLAPRGALIVVTPTARHLQELGPVVGMLRVDADKQERVHAQLSPYLQSVRREEIEFDLTLGGEDVRALVEMGPSAHHVGPDELAQRLSLLPETTPVTASVVVETFRRS